jgi:hypothetical protein
MVPFRARVALALAIVLGFSVLAGCASAADASDLETETRAVALATLPHWVAEPAPNLVLIAHGVESRSTTWPLALEEQMRSLGATADAWDFFRVEWHDLSLDRLRASRRGYDLGYAIGEVLARETDYETVHLIAHSAGAHVIQGVTDAYGDAPRRPYVQMTFLDPFVGRSVVQLFWGRRQFGRNADVVENFVTRDDTVPFTNSFLRRAQVNVDLDDSVPVVEEPASGHFHNWPVTWYLRSAGVNPGLGSAPALMR